MKSRTRAIAVTAACIALLTPMTPANAGKAQPSITVNCGYLSSTDMVSGTVGISGVRTASIQSVQLIFYSSIPSTNEPLVYSSSLTLNNPSRTSSGWSLGWTNADWVKNGVVSGSVTAAANVSLNRGAPLTASNTCSVS